MSELESKEQELLRKLQEAGKPQNYFTLDLKINDVLISEIVFPADKFSLKTLSETRTHFMMKDLSREVIKIFSEEEQRVQELIKKEQMDKLWNENESDKK